MRKICLGNLVKQVLVVHLGEECVLSKFFVLNHPLLQNLNQLRLVTLLVPHAGKEDDGQVEGGEIGEDLLLQRDVGSTTSTFPLKREAFPEARFANVPVGFEEFKHPLFPYLFVPIPIFEVASEKVKGDCFHVRSFNKVCHCVRVVRVARPDILVVDHHLNEDPSLYGISESFASTLAVI